MIYFNNAASSYPKPTEVISAVYSHLQNFPGYSSRSTLSSHHFDPISSCRQKIAQFFHISNPNHISFTSGSTEALNLAIQGLALKGTHVITTAIEHNSVLRPLKTLEKNGEIELTIVDCDSSGYVEPSQIAQAIQTNTKFAVINHCSNVTGTYLDIDNIVKMLHSFGILVMVDASQSGGEKIISIQDSDIDILAFTGHKSLYGMPGIGGLYIREGLEVLPLKTGGTGSKSELLYQPKERPIYFEAGTLNLPGIVSLEAGISFIEATGIEKIFARKRKIVESIWQELHTLPEISIYGRYQNNCVPSMFTFNLHGIDPSEVGYILEQSFGIIVRSGLHCAPLIHRPIKSSPQGCVRVSPSFFTTQEEVSTFIQALQKIYHAKYHRK